MHWFLVLWSVSTWLASGQSTSNPKDEPNLKRAVKLGGVFNLEDTAVELNMAQAFKLQCDQSRSQSVGGYKADWDVSCEVVNSHGDTYLAQRLTESFIRRGVAGIVAGSTEEMCDAIYLATGQANVPMISPGCQQHKFSNKQNYASLARIRPPYAAQGRPLANLAAQFKWRSVFAIHADDPESMDGVALLGPTAVSKGVQIAGDMTLRVGSQSALQESSQEVLDILMRRLAGESRVMVLHTSNPTHGWYFLEQARKRDLGSIMIWVLTEALTRFTANDVSPELRSYLVGSVGLRLSTTFSASAMQRRAELSKAWADQNLGPLPMPDSVPWAYDGTKTLFEALDKSGVFGPKTDNASYPITAQASLNKLQPWSEVCTLAPLGCEYPCSDLSLGVKYWPNGTQVTKAYANLSFEGVTAQVSFTSNLDRLGYFQVMNFNPASAQEQDSYTEAGSWNQGLLSIPKPENIVWTADAISVKAPPYAPPSRVAVRLRYSILCQLQTPFAQIKQTCNKTGCFNSTVGYSIDMMQAIADDLSFTYDIIPWNGTDTDEALQKIIDGSFDAFLGPTTITSTKLSYVDLTLPYFFGGYDILVKKQTKDPNYLLLASPFTWEVWIIVVSAVGGIAFINWWAERKANPDEFPDNTLYSAVNEGLWFTAAGFFLLADKAPRTFVGRVVAGTYYIMVFVIVATYTASLAATLTSANFYLNIGNVNDLYGIKVSVPCDSGITEYLQTTVPGVALECYKTFDDGLQALMDNRINALVGDAPSLDYFVRHQTQNPIVGGECATWLVGATFNKQGYGIALPLNSEGTSLLDTSLLIQSETGYSDKLYKKWWVKGATCEHIAPNSQGQRMTVEDFAGLFILQAMTMVFGLLFVGIQLLWPMVQIPFMRFLCLPRKKFSQWYERRKKLREDKNMVQDSITTNDPTAKNKKADAETELTTFTYGNNLERLAEMAAGATGEGGAPIVLPKNSKASQRKVQSRKFDTEYHAQEYPYMSDAKKEVERERRTTFSYRLAKTVREVTGAKRRHSSSESSAEDEEDAQKKDRSRRWRLQKSFPNAHVNTLAREGTSENGVRRQGDRRGQSRRVQPQPIQAGAEGAVSSPSEVEEKEKEKEKEKENATGIATTPAAEEGVEGKTEAGGAATEIQPNGGEKKTVQRTPSSRQAPSSPSGDYRDSEDYRDSRDRRDYRDYDRGRDVAYSRERERDAYSRERERDYRRAAAPSRRRRYSYSPSESSDDESSALSDDDLPPPRARSSTNKQPARSSSSRR